jgi:hypothetical protein
MNPSLSAKIHCESLDKARRCPLAVPDWGLEPSNMKHVGFDNFAEQSCTKCGPERSEERAAVPSREQSLSPQLPRCSTTYPQL